MSDTDDTLLGVVLPADPDQPPPTWDLIEERLAEAHPFFDHAASVVANSLQATRTRLRELRAERERINEEVRQLVEDEESLLRMHRVTLRRNGEEAE